MPVHGRYTTEKVTCPPHGETIGGVLYCIVIIGPNSFIEEQASLHYATQLADEGHAALIFDPRTVGESTGQPRRMETPRIKNEDAVAGLDYLISRGDVDKSRLFLVGICQGGPESLDIAYDDRVFEEASASGYSRDRCIYEKIGEVMYHPLVDPKAADPDDGSLAGLPGPTLKSFENRYTVVSELDHFEYTTVPEVTKFTKPVLIIHRDNCMSAPAAKQHCDSIHTSDKKLIWNNDASHFQHYDQPDRADIFRIIDYAGSL
ncbi:alpha/beta-hydrolase [Basidiobolus meristosporus CBS 931.73]|uniref:Alpha/beta-hydrolase n=1 Tax=Basidiobolus meristosporus CBS 931.73 TaxID=1314790 RepID=A0A1Y1YW82_9FUNG|nr:alpha/beta-hydrolase [Basidiobolus meristosporus CBS 931.73]|eukprot:ORY02312.1 alpha/beta-hydrolase [Basidiobolus meristosporus CBS 931.73]